MDAALELQFPEPRYIFLPVCNKFNFIMSLNFGKQDVYFKIQLFISNTFEQFFRI